MKFVPTRHWRLLRHPSWRVRVGYAINRLVWLSVWLMVAVAAGLSIAFVAKCCQ